MNRPTDVAITPGGDIFVADGYGNNRIVHFDDRGQFVGTWGSLGSLRDSSACLIRSRSILAAGSSWPTAITHGCRSSIRPAGFWMNGATFWSPGTSSITERDEIYVCGSSPMRWPRLPIPGLIVGIPPKDQLIMVFTPDGRATQLFTFPKGQHSGELDWVHALAVDRRGNLYLGDIQGRRPRSFSGSSLLVGSRNRRKVLPQTRRTRAASGQALTRSRRDCQTGKLPLSPAT